MSVFSFQFDDFFLVHPKIKYEKTRQISNVQDGNSTWTEKEASKNSDGLVNYKQKVDCHQHH